MIKLNDFLDAMQTVHGYNGTIEEVQDLKVIYESLVVNHNSEYYGDTLLVEDSSLVEVVKYWFEGGYTSQGIKACINNGYILFSYNNGMYQAFELSY